MAVERVKRGAERQDKQRNVKQHRDDEPVPELTLVIAPNMELVKLELIYQKREFQQARMYEFIRRSEDLTPVELDLLKEYLKNYDITNGHSHVGGLSIVINEMLLEQVLKLPTSELQVEGDPSSDFKLGSFSRLGKQLL